MSNPTFQVWVRQFYMSNEVRRLNCAGKCLLSVTGHVTLGW
ncbi:5794_t:CDS:1, partial [Funneliformis mosseae]